MNETKTPIQRFGAYGLLFFVIVVILLGWRTGFAGGELTTAVTPPAESTESTTPAPTEAVADTAVAPLPVFSDSGLSPDPVPFTLQSSQPQHDLQTYIVERGDTPNGIAEQFGIQTETLLGGNPKLSHEASLLQTGVELIILPIDGVLHDVAPGDTLEGIAQLYGVTVDEIVAYEPNNLEFPYRLYPDTQIMVPGAVREVFIWTPPDLSSVTGGTSGIGSGVKPVIVGTGTFVFPVSSRNFTQYFWYGHQGIDIGLPEGSAVYASDTGTVTYAGWNTYGYGNLIVVNHGNGYETFYAHLSSMNVVPGQIVYQGNVIGGTGNTGNSSGPHIHFEIRLNNNRDNPCWYFGC